MRQALGQRRQLEKESVADYSYSLRTHCARINLPRSEWTHYFVQGLIPEIREYVFLQQPENLEAAENFAKLKESVLAGSNERADFNPQELSAQILEELSNAINPKDKSISAVGPALGQNPYVNKSKMKQIIRDEFRELMGSNINARPSQGVLGLALAMPFATIVVEKDILIVFVAQNLLLEIFAEEVVDKIFYQNRGKGASDWQPKQQRN